MKAAVAKDRLRIQYVPLSSLKPWGKNPRRNDDAAAKLAELIKRHGFVNPIIADAGGTIRAGHTRYKAARALGLVRVPVVFVDFKGARDAEAYALADNKSHEWSDWDMPLLAQALRDLEAGGIPLEETGFSAEELAAAAGYLDPNEGLTDPDAIPDPPETPTTRPGDLWILGNHRLLCGDSSKRQDLDRLLAGSRIHLVNTDPPYNVKVEPRSNNAIAAAGRGRRTHQAMDLARRPAKAPTTRKLRAKDRPLMNDFLPEAAFEELLRAWFGNLARVLVPGGAFYIWGGYVNCANYPAALKESGLYFSQAIIWIKEHPVLTRKDFMGNHEWCFYGWREGGPHRFFGPRNIPDTWRPTYLPGVKGITPTAFVEISEEAQDLVPRDVWRVRKVTPQKMVHLTEKPVELAARAMGYSSLPGENVLDLFGGSGSTLIAAEKTGRRAHLMELDPLYCDVIVRRFEKFTGRKASRQKAA